MTDPLRNPRDPLRKAGPEAELELFRLFGKLANDYPTDAVIGAAMNVIVNAIRQAHPSRRGAQMAFEAIAAQTKNLLLEKHYDNIGNRRNIYPYTQNIEVPFMDLRSKH